MIVKFRHFYHTVLAFDKNKVALAINPRFMQKVPMPFHLPKKMYLSPFFLQPCTSLTLITKKTLKNLTYSSFPMEIPKKVTLCWSKALHTWSRLGSPFTVLSSHPPGNRISTHSTPLPTAALLFECLYNTFVRQWLGCQFIALSSITARIFSWILK